jgi:hypothetical protein
MIWGMYDVDVGAASSSINHAVARYMSMLLSDSGYISFGADGAVTKLDINDHAASKQVISTNIVATVHATQQQRIIIDLKVHS